MPYVYILECADGSYYTGSTWNLEQRLWEHQNGLGANHTAKRQPVKLVYCEEGDRIEDAFRREKQIQGWSRRKKQALIAGRTNQLHAMAECRNESHWRSHGGVGFDSAQPTGKGGEHSQAASLTKNPLAERSRSQPSHHLLALHNTQAATMAEQEGVIKYRLDYKPAPAMLHSGFAELNAWRSVLFRLGLIGQDPARYGGLGYGNLSLLLDDGSFIVTGTQTGHLPHLTQDHYVRVLQARPQDNYLQAEGPIAPSSEALTHAAIYTASAKVRCVVHGHSLEIWRRATELNLPTVAADIAYGTPAMAAAVSALVAANPEQGVIAMLGHEDGLLAYGATPELACWPLARCLAQAFALDSPLPLGEG